MNSIGAYYQVYKNKRATDFVLSKFRDVFPESPILLISDGGDNFDDLALKHKTSYVKLYNIFGEQNVDRLYDCERMIEGWRRHKLAVENAQTEYIMILEDDVLIQRQFHLGKFDSKGVYVGNYLPADAINEIHNCKGYTNNDQYGMCGGSVYSSNAFLNSYDSMVKYTNEFHNKLYFNRPHHDPNRKVCAIDCNLVFHFNRCGFSYSKAEWLSEVLRQNDWKDYPVVHQYKELY